MAFPQLFFQAHWDVVGTEVVNFCQTFIATSTMPHSVNDTHIILVPKKKQSELMSDFRPIALCNVVYRILAKVLANRFRGVLNTIISCAQSAFILGRSIIDNVLIMNLLMLCISKKRLEEGLGL